MTTPTLPTEDLPGDRNLAHAALAYLGQIGRAPASEQRWSAGDRRYLAGSLIVGVPAWGGDTPAWLQDALRIARLGLVLAGGHAHASESVILTASATAAPRSSSWPTPGGAGWHTSSCWSPMATAPSRWRCPAAKPAHPPS